jgi:hypothetical protein
VDYCGLRALLCEAATHGEAGVADCGFPEEARMNADERGFPLLPPRDPRSSAFITAGMRELKPVVEINCRR